MGNWEKLQDEKREGREKDKVRREKLACFFTIPPSLFWEVWLSAV